MAPPATRKGGSSGSRSASTPAAKKAKAASGTSSVPSGGPTVVISQPSPAPAAAPQRVADASSPGQQQQPVSYAQATSSPVKRPVADAPAFPRPPLVRGRPTFQVDTWESLERPAPRAIDHFVLYADLRSVSLTPHAALLALHQAIGKDAVGVQVYTAQKAVSVTFATEELFRKYRNQLVADTGMLLYPALPDPVYLQKLTLQGCPTGNRTSVTAAICEKFKPYGTVACVVPMEVEGTGWCTDTFQVTLQVSSVDAALPPPQLELFENITITVDAPGRRRFCKFCQSATHTRYDCRQGQRQRNAQKINRQKEAQFLRDQAADSSDDDTVHEEESQAGTSTTEETAKETAPPSRKTPEPEGSHTHKDDTDTHMDDVSHDVASHGSRGAFTPVSGTGTGNGMYLNVGNSYALLDNSRQGLADGAFNE